jgi:hypothetical protein
VTAELIHVHVDVLVLVHLGDHLPTGNALDVV